MAIYHFSGTIISRSQGRSAVACAAYRSAEKLVDERYKKTHDYTHKQDVAFTEILLPENAPSSEEINMLQKIPFNQVKVNDTRYRCSIGRSGVIANKEEGDGGTPKGGFYLRKVFYRSDTINETDIKTTLPIQVLQADDGWCDDVKCEEYNQHIKLPFPGSHEKLWRDDNLYDLIVVVGYNDYPIEKGKGSAIFLHIARENYAPTVGCIAFNKKDLLEILEQLTPETILTIADGNEIYFQSTKQDLEIATAQQSQSSVTLNNF